MNIKIKVTLIIFGSMIALIIVSIIMAGILAIASHLLPTILSKMVG